MKASVGTRVRCAIYTRKSSEEGLEQSFNSLQAQREACEAYVTSQRHEGWQAMPKKYDDGGFSGGNMNRPALKQLLEDIAAGHVDTIVVYKVDRLTRSLTDFAKMVEAFDEKGVSFVSVTQQFNTTTSMGRLTLNVLLSFAQFEREVTGERIRDKIAASKKKGMWMGGVVPLGYDLNGRQLVVNPKDAKLVQEIFSQYLSLGSVAELKQYLDRKRIRTKVRTSSNGRTFGGMPYSRGGLYKLLKNEVYIGRIAHREESYVGQQPAIIEPEMWARVSALLANNNQGQRTRGRKVASSTLVGILFDEQGNRYTPTHAVNNGKRYRYYTSQAAIQKRGNAAQLVRLPASQIEQLVCARIQGFLRSPQELYSALNEAGILGSNSTALADAARQLVAKWGEFSGEQVAIRLRLILKRVVLKATELDIQLDLVGLTALLQDPSGAIAVAEQRQRTQAERLFNIACPFRPCHRFGELRLILPTSDPVGNRSQGSILKAIARALQWKDDIIAGRVHCKEQVAAQSHLNAAYVGRILRLGALSPQLVDSITREVGPVDRPLEWLINQLPLDWSQQESAVRSR
jgi:site-specific DNA recombinase